MTTSLVVVDSDQMVRDAARRNRLLLVVTVWLAVVIGVVGAFTAPDAFSLALLALVLACIATAIRPAIGIYLIVFFSLVGDAETSPWWPFTKNMSSKESIFYVSDVLSITPLEVLLVVTMGSFLVRAVADRTWRFRRGRMLWPLAIFTLFVAMGFLRGVGNGGDRTVAIFEVRPLLYIPLLYILVTNLIITRRQYRRVFGLALVAVAVQSIFSLLHYRSMPAEKRAVLETLSEHTATVHMNALFIFFVALIVLGGSRWKIWCTLLLLPPVVYAYLLSQRRAAMVAMFIGLIMLAGVLFFRRRRMFWFVVPTMALLGLAFVLVTWNAQGGLGLPATAVKTVLFPDELTTHDRDSNLYRELEAFNLWFTIRESPITGFGFGQKFLVVAPMPDISFFEEWQYLPHNSVLWVWIKTGFFGFVTMLYLFARAVQRGARTVLRVTSSDDAAMVMAALAYVTMFLVFAYVDIGWDIRPAVFLALCLGLCADFDTTPETAPAPSPAEPAYRPMTRVGVLT